MIFGAVALFSGWIGERLRAHPAIGERLKCGLLHINDQTVADECSNPFGGRGDSGNGGSVGGRCTSSLSPIPDPPSPSPPPIPDPLVVRPRCPHLR